MNGARLINYYSISRKFATTAMVIVAAPPEAIVRIESHPALQGCLVVREWCEGAGEWCEGNKVPQKMPQCP